MLQSRHSYCFPYMFWGVSFSYFLRDTNLRLLNIIIIIYEIYIYDLSGSSLSHCSQLETSDDQYNFIIIIYSCFPHRNTLKVNLFSDWTNVVTETNWRCSENKIIVLWRSLYFCHFEFEVILCLFAAVLCLFMIVSVSLSSFFVLRVIRLHNI